MAYDVDLIVPLDAVNVPITGSAMLIVYDPSVDDGESNVVFFRTGPVADLVATVNAPGQREMWMHCGYEAMIEEE